MAAIFGDIVWKLGVWEEVWMCLASMAALCGAGRWVRGLSLIWVYGWFVVEGCSYDGSGIVMAAIFGDIVWKLGVWEEVWMCLVLGAALCGAGRGVRGLSRIQVRSWFVVEGCSYFLVGNFHPRIGAGMDASRAGAVCACIPMLGRPSDEGRSNTRFLCGLVLVCQGDVVLGIGSPLQKYLL